MSEPSVSDSTSGTIVNSCRPSSGCRGFFFVFRCDYSWFTTGRSSPAHVAAFPVLSLGDGADPLRATCQLLPHSHYGVVDQRPWTDRPLLMFPAFRCDYSWFTTGRSSPAHVAAFPGLPSATGRIPFGRPVTSSRTLTTGLWTNGPGPTALCWEDAHLPAPGNSSG